MEIATTDGANVPSPTALSVKQARNARGILVPLLEDLFRKPLEIEDDEDRKFLHELIEARSRKRKKGIYSPSMLASCVRQVYFAKTQTVTAMPSQSKRAHGYFLNGNFLHFKWQFALWKLHRAGKIKLIGCEIFVLSKNGDWGGTLDALIEVNGILFIVDIKGRESNAFLQIIANGGPLAYHVQITGYAMLASVNLPHGKIEKAIMLYENKNGPARVRNASPIALYEEVVEIPKYKKVIARRLESLREYERKEEIPPPECVSTKSSQFLDCPFLAHCRGEIERIERKAATGSDAAKPRARLSRKSRTDRTRQRNSTRG